MSFFKKTKKPAYPSIRLTSEDSVLFEGLLSDLPLKESAILDGSVRFFHDPEPCFIHRNAVRIRLIEDILRELSSTPPGEAGPLLRAYSDFPEISSCTLTEL